MATYRYDHLRQQEFSQLQNEFVVGTTLGDAHLDERPSGSVRLMVTHCEQQKELISMAVSILDQFVVRKEPRQSYKKKKDGSSNLHLTIESISHPKLREFRKLFYTKDRFKIVPEFEVIKDYLSPFTLAVLIMDDGWRNKDHQMGISSEGFLEEGNLKLQEMLHKAYGINSKIYSYFRRGKRYYHNMFDVVNSKKISNIIKGYVLDSFRYKLV